MIMEIQNTTTGFAPARTNLHTLSTQWKSRPMDERFLNLDDLETAVARRTEYATTEVLKLNAVMPRTVADVTNSGIVLSTDTHEQVGMTNFSFGQLCSEVGAPASYLRDLPGPLAAANLQWGLAGVSRKRDDVAFYVDTDPLKDIPELRAVTSPRYGRIYDLEIVKAVKQLNAAQGERWVVPAASYADADPKRATTLYAGDRDCFIFLCDPSNPIEIPGQKKPSFRGFMVSNSEVGAGCFVLTTLLYETICDNRIIWGASQIGELRIRHTSGAPERFLRDAQPQLLNYANRAAGEEIERITRAQNIRLQSAKAANSSTYEDILGWVRETTGLSKSMVDDGIKFAKAEEGKADTIWDVVQGITASARTIANADNRLKVELAATKLLNRAA